MNRPLAQTDSSYLVLCHTVQAEIAHERREILEDTEHEFEELVLLYQLKGLSEDESRKLASHIAKDTDFISCTSSTGD